MTLNTKLKTIYDFDITEEEQVTILDLSMILQELRFLFRKQTSIELDDYIMQHYSCFDRFLSELGTSSKKVIQKAIEYADNYC